MKDAHAEEHHHGQDPSCGDHGCAASHLWSSFLSGSGTMTL
jgi:hypothetical protein